MYFSDKRTFYRVLDTRWYKNDNSVLFICSEYGNVEINRIFIDWSNEVEFEFAFVALWTEFNSSKLEEEMTSNNLLHFYGLIHYKELDIKRLKIVSIWTYGHFVDKNNTQKKLLNWYIVK